MPRLPREISEFGFYHVILRGSGRQILFENDSDRREFLQLLAEKTAKYKVSVLAWCLMDNHVHLLLEDPSDSSANMSKALHDLCLTYALRFNYRAGHVGHVFLDRFHSSAIHDDAYLLEAMRYIHNNPANAGICRAENYRWSSYHEYLGDGGVADTELVLEMCGGKEGFIEFVHARPQTPYVFDRRARFSDEELLAVATSVLGDMKPSEVKTLSVDQRNEVLIRMREAKITSLQIERLTGIGRQTVRRVFENQ